MSVKLGVHLIAALVYMLHVDVELMSFCTSPMVMHLLCVWKGTPSCLFAHSTYFEVRVTWPLYSVFDVIE